MYSDFGIENDKKLQEFYSIRDEYFRSKDKELKLRLEKLANALSKEGSELETIVSFYLKQIEKYSKGNLLSIIQAAKIISSYPKEACGYLHMWMH